MVDAPNSIGEALQFARHEHYDPSRNWKNYCQMFVRSCYGIPPAFGSAWAQWLGADDEDKHAGGSPSEAPLGSALCYKGSSPYGHIMLAAVRFKTGTPAAWSNDLVRTGYIDKVNRTAPTSEWGQYYLGYLTAVNHYDLPIGESKPVPPKPKPKPYLFIDRAVGRLEVARDTARKNHDTHDVEVLNKEIKRLHNLYRTLRRND